LAAGPALADWVVTRVSQPARYAVDGRSWRPLAVGMEVPNHAWVHTGRSGRLVLRNGGEAIQFKPNTVAAISRRVERGRDTTTILQKFGSVLIIAEPRQHRTRAVETPFLAAVVRGTRFEVHVDSRSARVQVHEGVVGATHQALGLAVQLQAGQAVIADGQRQFRVQGGSGSRVERVAPRNPRVSAARAARGGFGAQGESDAERLRERRERQVRAAIRASREQNREDPDGHRGIRPDGQGDVEEGAFRNDERKDRGDGAKRKAAREREPESGPDRESDGSDRDGRERPDDDQTQPDAEQPEGRPVERPPSR
jgi:hypothetical protein